MKPQKINLDCDRRQAKPRERVRSTVFEDEVDKAARRENRRHTDRQLIEEELDVELESLEELEEDFLSYSLYDTFYDEDEN